MMIVTTELLLSREGITRTEFVCFQFKTCDSSPEKVKLEGLDWPAK